MKINRLPQFVLLGMLAVTSLSAYKTSHPSAPDMANHVAGQYTLTQVNLAGKTYSATEVGMQGSVSISRQSASQVAVALTIVNKLNPDDDALNGTLKNITLTDAGNNEVELRNGTVRFGRISADRLTINSKHENEVLFTLTATR